MTWSNKIYVATSSLGVYYTNNFTDPTIQPTWTAINTGLGALNCIEFWLDPFEPDDRQYVLVNTGRVLYRRVNQGSWTEILSSASLGTLTGRAVTLQGFCIDSVTQGRLWVLYTANYNGSNSQYRLAKTDDYGDSWTTLLIYNNSFNFLYGHESVRAIGDVLFVPLSTMSGGSQRVYYSVNAGASWSSYNMGFNAIRPLALNSLTPDRCYTADANDGEALVRITTAGAYTKFANSIGPQRWDAMWFHPTDADHQRLLRWNYMYVTANEWTNNSTAGTIAPYPVSFAPYSGNDTDQILVGLTLGAHVIGCLTNEADTTATGIAGTNAGGAPYTDSIPHVCGGLARMGIQAVPLVTNLYTYDVEFEIESDDDSVHVSGVVME